MKDMGRSPAGEDLTGTHLTVSARGMASVSGRVLSEFVNTAPGEQVYSEESCVARNLFLYRARDGVGQLSASSSHGR